MARDVPSVGGDNIFPNFATVRELWNVWEIHCLILVSLFLQVILFFFAGMRSRSSSGILRIVLWLAYLSADSVAIFVLGHLVVHADGPRHHLMYFWAPFVLIHLGGQDAITAFSKQDNELWRRHLLNFVTQVAMAGYVVATASWPNPRLKTAMALMFLSGCFKYAERMVCLFISSPLKISSSSVDWLSRSLSDLKVPKGKDGNTEELRKHAKNYMNAILTLMLQGRSQQRDITNIMTEDAPRSELFTVLIAEDLPGMLMEFRSRGIHSGAYKYVGSCLLYCYQRLHTKHPLRQVLHGTFWQILLNSGLQFCNGGPALAVLVLLACILFVLYIVFQFASAILALMLFMAAERGDPLDTSRADITVSYVLLGGAIALEVCSFFSNLRYLPDGTIKSAVCRVARCIQPEGSRKQWSQELAQYSIIKTRALKSGRLSTRQFRKRLAARFSDTTHIPITECHTPIKNFVIDNLLCLGERKEWDITGSRGKLALQRWMDSHEDPDSARTGKTLEKSIDLDFSTSVLIWNIATGMCYYCGQNNSSSDSDQMQKDKQVSRELSNYITYLVFNCKVLLTTSSRLLHKRAKDEISELLSKLPQDNRGEEDFVRELFKQEEQDLTVEIQKSQENNEQDDSMLTKIQMLEELDDTQDSTVIEIMMPEELDEEQQEVTEIQKPEESSEAQDSRTTEIEKHKNLDEEQYSMVTEIKKHAERVDDSNLQKLVQSTLEALDSPVLPRARGVAQELIGIKDAAERWHLIATVWLEMLYYVAPRCGGAFHYEHLSTGGEFVTHVLLLMQFLGPFLPPPSA